MTLILLVDDDPLIADTVSAILGNVGYTVGVLSDGRVAREVIELKKPALVLLDCVMPYIPGMEVLRQIRTCPALFTVPILMLTARWRTVDRDIAMLAGATGYMSKPFEADQLVSKVGEMISHDQLRGASAGSTEAIAGHVPQAEHSRTDFR